MQKITIIVLFSVTLLQLFKLGKVYSKQNLMGWNETKKVPKYLSIKTITNTGKNWYLPTLTCYKNKNNKTGVINDPLGQTHSHAFYSNWPQVFDDVLSCLIFYAY